MRAAERRNAALGLHLAEPAVFGRHDDVARQHHLDADGEDDALHGGDDRLPAAVAQAERVDIAFLTLASRRVGPKNFGMSRPAVKSLPSAQITPTQ